MSKIDWDQPIRATNGDLVQAGMVGDRRVVIYCGAPYFADEQGFLMTDDDDDAQSDAYRVRNVRPAPPAAAVCGQTTNKTTDSPVFRGADHGRIPEK